MPGKTSRWQGLWYRLSAGQVRGLSVLIGAGVSAEVAFIGYILLYELGSPGKMLIVTALVTGIVSGLLALTLIARARERRLRLLQWLRMIREMNHYTRNALEEINYSAYSTGDRDVITTIRAGAARIEWALREILTQHGAYVPGDNSEGESQPGRSLEHSAAAVRCARAHHRGVGVWARKGDEPMKPAVACKVMVAILLIVMLAALGMAQTEASATLKYDVAKEATLKGNIDDIKEIASAKGPSLHLLVKAGSEITEVYLCPNAFLRELAFNFAKGDQVTIVGSKVKVDNVDVVLAREVTRGNDTLTLRDKKGNPVWMPVKKG